MGWMFEALDLENDTGNRHRLDRAIKKALEMEPDTPCPEVWAYLKALSDEERFDLIDTIEKGFAE
jgi:hypothetical protein